MEEKRLQKLYGTKKRSGGKRRKRKNKSSSSRPLKKPRQLGAAAAAPDDAEAADGADNAAAAEDSEGTDSQASSEAEALSDDDAPVAPWILRQIDVVEAATKAAKAKATPKSLAQKISKWLPKRGPRFGGDTGGGDGPAGPAASAEPASSSTDPMPARANPPPAESAEDGDEALQAATSGRKRSYLEQTCDIDGFGSIHFDPPAQNFVAFCRQKGHEDCRKSRTCKPSTLPARAGQGRPLGLLAQWLFCGKNHSTREAHQAPKLLSSFTQAERLSARQRFLKLPGAEAMARNERVRREDEAEEPDRDIYSADDATKLSCIIQALWAAVIAVNMKVASCLSMQQEILDGQKEVPPASIRELMMQPDHPQYEKNLEILAKQGAKKDARTRGDSGGFPAWKAQAVRWSEAIGVDVAKHRVWTSRRDFVGRGVPQNERVQTMLDLVCLQKWSEHPNRGYLRDVVWPDLMCNVFLDWSQNPARRAYSGKNGEMRCLTTSSQLYSFEADRALFPIEYMRLQGWGFDIAIPEQCAGKMRELSGQGMSLPCLGAVIWAVYLLKGAQEQEASGGECGLVAVLDLQEEVEWASFNSKSQPTGLWCGVHLKVVIQLYPDQPPEVVAVLYHEDSEAGRTCKRVIDEAAQNLKDGVEFSLPATVSSMASQGVRLVFEMAFCSEGDVVRLAGHSSKFLKLQEVLLQPEQRGHPVLAGFLLSLRGLPLDEVFSLRRVQVYRDTALVLREDNLQPEGMVHESQPSVLLTFLSRKQTESYPKEFVGHSTRTVPPTLQQLIQRGADFKQQAFLHDSLAV
ncbi:unnamed protein product [Symbiodinium sp. CCMP2592]|nr:unnamed protein product [Symbiodinium sp. CCMP2592]